MAFQSTAFALKLWRFLSGIGIGVELVVIGTYLSELVPKHIRWPGLRLLPSRWFHSRTGRCLSLLSARATGAVRHRWLALGRTDRRAWRRLHLVDPPGLAGEPALARPEGQVRRSRQHHDGFGNARRGRIWALSAIAGSAGPRSSARPDARDVDPPYLTRSIMMIIFNIFQTVSFYGFLNWVPILLIKQGITITNSLFYTAFVLEHSGVAGVFVFIATAMLVALLVVALMGPRTRNLALEQISN
jgi:MFS transporter, putative metabolite:H+ symporter